MYKIKKKYTQANFTFRNEFGNFIEVTEDNIERIAKSKFAAIYLYKKKVKKSDDNSSKSE